MTTTPPAHGIITVNRMMYPELPRQCHILHPDLQRHGPRTFNLIELEQYFVEGQKEVWIPGERIYKDLEGKKNLHERCLNLQDLEEIRRKIRMEIFEIHFPRMALFGWKSVIQKKGESFRCVPYVYLHHGHLEISWRALTDHWNKSGLTLIHAA